MDIDNCFMKNMVDSDEYLKEIKNIKEIKASCIALCYVLNMEYPP